VRAGYGITECMGVSTVAHMDDNAPRTLGAPLHSCCIRLRDWDEGGYLAADRTDPAVGMARGEVLVGGPTVTPGYFIPKPDLSSGKEAQEAIKYVQKRNAEDFVTIQGVRYMCTGDIGQITAEGNLQIIDRKKDLVKLQQGEYVALSKVEAALKNSPYVALPFVYAKPTMSYALAVINPAPEAVRKLAGEVGADASAGFAKLCEDEAVVAAVLADVRARCKAAGLASFETPGKVLIVAEEFTIENGQLTTTMKLRRREIYKAHEAAIDRVYV